MNTDVLQGISVISFIFAAIFIILAIILFFKMDVRAIIDDLSGKKAERQIRAYRENSLSFKIGKSNIPEHPDYYRMAIFSAGEDTAKLEKNDKTDTLIQTALLENGTTLLNDEETTLLNSSGTTLLDNSEETGQEKYILVLDEMIIHTTERV